MTDEQIREEIAGVIVKIIKADRAGRQTEVDAVDQILSLKGIRIEVDNQDLPENPNEWSDEDWMEAKSYAEGQQDMLTLDKDGNVWVKCKGKK